MGSEMCIRDRLKTFVIYRYIHMVGTLESLTHASRGDWLYRSRAMLHSSYVEKESRIEKSDCIKEASRINVLRCLYACAQLDQYIHGAAYVIMLRRNFLMQAATKSSKVLNPFTCPAHCTLCLFGDLVECICFANAYSSQSISPWCRSDAWRARFTIASL